MITFQEQLMCFSSVQQEAQCLLISPPVRAWHLLDYSPNKNIVYNLLKFTFTFNNCKFANSLYNIFIAKRVLKVLTKTFK